MTKHRNAPGSVSKNSSFASTANWFFLVQHPPSTLRRPSPLTLYTSLFLPTSPISTTMGHITYDDAIAIFQLVYYTPCLLGSIFVAARHGATKTSGWIFLTIFCVIRLVGAGSRIATISDTSSDTPYTIALVCSVLGLSPLLMSSLGLIARAYYSIMHQPWNTISSMVVVKIVHTPAVVALILCIVGATSASVPAKIESEPTVKIGIILYVVVYAMLVLLTLGAWYGKRRTGEGEGMLVLAVFCALPLILVRLLYAVLATFSHRHEFDPATASQTIQLFMSVIEEMAVVVIYLATGMKLPAVPADRASNTREKMAYRFGRGDFGTGKMGLFSLGAGLISAKLQKRPQQQ